MSEKKGMRSIWFLVGLIMLIIGLIVVAAGIYDFFYPSGEKVKLSGLHTNIWWGALIVIAGALYVIKNKDKYVDV
jgi:uncharacterized membrane protein